MTIYHVNLTLFVVGKSVRYHLPELVHVVKMCQFSIDLHFINNIVIFNFVRVKAIEISYRLLVSSAYMLQDRVSET
jgi:hypothetical protein